MKFEHKDQHSCDAAVIMCVDFRFTDAYLTGVREVFGVSTFDTWAVPGAAKNFVSPENKVFADILIEKIRQVSVGLHDIKKIIILDHADCGAYGGRKAFESIESETHKHQEDLCLAQECLAAAFPGIEVHVGIASLNEDHTVVEVVQCV